MLLALTHTPIALLLGYPPMLGMRLSFPTRLNQRRRKALSKKLGRLILVVPQPNRRHSRPLQYPPPLTRFLAN